MIFFYLEFVVEIWNRKESFFLAFLLVRILQEEYRLHTSLRYTRVYNTESFDYFLFIKPVYEMSFDLFLCPIHTSIYSTIIEYDLNNELLFLIEM